MMQRLHACSRDSVSRDDPTPHVIKAHRRVQCASRDFKSPRSLTEKGSLVCGLNQE